MECALHEDDHGLNGCCSTTRLVARRTGTMTVTSDLRTSQLARTAGERIYRIVGGNQLNGSVRIGGAKNAALPMLAATLLTSEPVVLNDVPNLADIANMIEILQSLGAEVEWDRA